MQGGARAGRHEAGASGCAGEGLGALEGAALPHLPPRPSPPRAAGEIKGELIRVLSDMVARHQEARAAVTEEVVDAFMAVRPMAGVV